MSLRVLDLGYIPLVDSAPLIIAHEIGFAAEEGLGLRLHRERSWASLRDKLVWGHYQAAHMLAPVPIAQSAGLAGMATAIDALLVLSVNGSMIGVRPDIADRMRAESLDFLDADATGRAMIAAANGRLRVGVPFPFSMHAELIHYWIESLGAEAREIVDIRTVPPSQMDRAAAEDEVDAFCVGEPWGSVAVESGVAELILPSAAIWRFAPEKVLAVRHDWCESHPVTAAALMRAVWRAGRWLAEAGNSTTVAEILGRSEYLNVSPEIIERPLVQRLVINQRGTERRVPGAVEFFDGAAQFPWRSQALWIAEALARRTGHDRSHLRAVARGCFRSDLFRSVLGPTGADLPGASEKLEGALRHRSEAASTLGRLLLGPDFFFDGRTFDPSVGD